MAPSHIRIEDIVDLKFFHDLGRVTADEAMERWSKWLEHPRRNTTEEQKYRKVMQIAAGLGEAAIRHYLEGRHDELSPATVKLLDRLTRALHRTPPVPAGERTRARRRRTLQPRVAFLTQLTVPSESFHFDVLRGVVLEAAEQNVSVSIHEVSPTRFASAIERIHTVYDPDAILMLRLTPTRRELEALAQAEIPTVLLHADRQVYEAPILRNIVPTHAKMPASIERWLEEHAEARRLALLGAATPKPRGGRSSSRGKARKQQPELVVVAMKEESDDGDFPPISELVKRAVDVRGVSQRGTVIRRSIRNDRRDQLWIAVKDRDHAWVDLTKDYSYLRAKDVLEAYPHAGAYIALSDQVAAGLEQLLSIRDGDGTWKHRILGFDNTVVAREERFPSFDQRRQDVGVRGIRALKRFLASREEGSWPPFEEEHIEVELATRS